jgi:hypothetical protein
MQIHTAANSGTDLAKLAVSDAVLNNMGIASYNAPDVAGTKRRAGTPVYAMVATQEVGGRHTGSNPLGA